MDDQNDSKRAGGRPPGVPGIRAEAARHSRDCIRVLAEVANSAQAPDADRVRAAEVILGLATSKSAPSSATEEQGARGQQ